MDKDSSSNLEALSALTDRLTRLETEYEGFFLVAPDMFAVMYWEPGQKQGDIRFSKVNKAWEDVLGYTVEEMTTENYQDKIHPEDRDPDYDPDEPVKDIGDWDSPEVQEQLRIARERAEAEGKNYDFDPNRPVQLMSYVQRWIAKDGTVKYLSWRATFDLRARAAYCVARDVTDSINLSENLHIKRHILKNVTRDYLPDAIRDLQLSKDRLEEVLKTIEREIGDET